jgi:two-component system, chemotaxis family, protein-glutamate methylesterase/glutaminase
MKIKVMVVDDSALYRQLVKNVLRNFPDVEVVGLACTGKEALEKIPELRPDLLTLDVQMPDMNGLELLREIKKRRLPVKSIMLSSFTAHGAQITMDALLAGAFDFIQKPNTPDANANRSLLEGMLTEKINAFLQSQNTTMPARSPSPDLRAGIKHPIDTRVHLSRTSNHQIAAVVIGTSTGGPIALSEVIPKLPASLGVPIFVVQHMPPKYTQSLAARLAETSQVAVREGANGMRVEANHVYIAPGGLQMGFEAQYGGLIIRILDDPPEHNCRPSVDYTLRAAHGIFGGNVLSVILTGMGRDGTEGSRLIKQAGGSVLAQHPEGCIVYGMPKAVVEEQLADRVVPIEKIASWITRLIEKSRSPSRHAPEST